MRLDLDRRDLRAPSRPFAPGTRLALRLWFFAALTAIAIIGFAVWHSARDDRASNPTPVHAPLAAAPAPAPAANSVGMVITAEEAEAAHSPIMLHVTSDPAGAGVFVNGKKLGFTPGDFEWTPDRADPRRRLILQLRRTGYTPQTSRHSIDVSQIDFDAKLQPLSREPEPKASEDDSESESDEPETESPDPPPPEP